MAVAGDHSVGGYGSRSGRDKAFGSGYTWREKLELKKQSGYELTADGVGGGGRVVSLF